MAEIFKLFNGTTEADMQNGGVFTSVTWEQLLPAIKEAILIRDNEIVDGLVISEERIGIKLSRKKGRKPNTP